MSVYIIVDKNEPSMYYLGSTKNMSRRKPVHKSDCKTSDTKVYRYIREHGGWDNFEFEVIEECDNYFEREKELIIELEPPLNMVQYNFDRKACDKALYEKNKEKILKQAKAYRIENRDKIIDYLKEWRIKNQKQQLEKAKVKVKCECGSIVRKDSIARHKRSEKHRLYQNHQIH